MSPNPSPYAGIITMLFWFAILGIWYFVLTGDQRKKAKEHQKLLENLKKNDEVVTMAGIHGTIVNVKEKTFVLRIDDEAKMEIDKNAVSYVKKQREEEK
jgi:preprotein translocase subunit YajC